MHALCLCGRNLTAGQGSGFKDPFEAEFRLLIAFLDAGFCFSRSSRSSLFFFWLTHFNLIAILIVRLARQYLVLSFRNTTAKFRSHCRNYQR